jgi:2-dehydropantoate 2-reductase
MRQVPHYLLIGNGRVARHFQHYFSLLQISFSHWQRQHTLEELQEKIKLSSHILILISDHAIKNFIATHLKNSGCTLIHFSGSLVTDLAHGAHPLMTFAEDLYLETQYKTIPFVIDQDAPDFHEILPGLTNQHVRLEKSLKAKYHALCVLSGNFSCMLWQKLFSTLEKEFKLPAAIAHPYFLQQTKNLYTNPETALTGPLVRADFQTINKNLQALESDPFREVYQSFVACYQKLEKEMS